MEQGPVKSHVYSHDCIQQILKSVEIVYHHVKLSTNMYSTILDHSCIYEIHIYLKKKHLVTRMNPYRSKDPRS